MLRRLWIRWVLWLNGHCPKHGATVGFTCYPCLAEEAANEKIISDAKKAAQNKRLREMAKELWQP